MNSINYKAVQYAIAFTEDRLIPAKYKSLNNSSVKKRLKTKPGKSSIDEKLDKKKDNKLLIDFELTIDYWNLTLEGIQKRICAEQASRFISIQPNLDEELSKITDSTDFIDFNQYLSDRRDNQNCTPEEIGCLCMLLGVFQKNIEEHIARIHPSNTLSDPDAEKLRLKGRIMLDNVEINFWNRHTRNTVNTQQTWNNVRSYTELNSNTSGINGDVVFTGTMQIPRRDAQEYASKLGFKVHSSISRNVNYVIVGTENVSPSKIADVIKIREQGYSINIVDEVQFLEMVGENMDSNNMILKF